MNNNNNNNNNFDNTELFFKFYRINYIKNIIFYYVKLYKIYSSQRIFSTLEELLNYKNKEYLQDVLILFNEDFDFGLLPELKTLSFTFAKKELLYDIPSTITSLVAPSNYNPQYYKSAVNLKTLNIRFVNIGYSSPYFNELESLTELTLPNYRLMIEKQFFPANLKKFYVSVDKHYKRDIISLPDNLEYFKLGTGFVMKRYHINSNLLPNGLKVFKMPFNSNILPNDFNFPSNVTSLCLGFDSTFHFNSNLPSGLKKLKLKFSSLSTDLCNSIILPLSIETFQLLCSNYYNNQVDIARNIIPNSSSLTKLKLVNIPNILDPNDSQTILPANLKYLEFTNYYQKSSFNRELKTNQLPSTIKILKLCGTFNNGDKPLNEIIFPSDLEVIEFGDSFNQPLGSNIFSNKLKSIIFGNSFNQILNAESIPSSVESIEIRCQQYSHTDRLAELLDKLPNLKFYGFKNTQIYQNIPDKLVSLSLPKDFNYQIKELNLQDKSNLQHLSFNWSFNQPLLAEYLPKENKIKTLEVNGDFDQIINLDDFKHLETLIVNYGTPTLTTSYTDKLVVNNNLKGLYTSQIKNYNLYNLKQIIVSINNFKFLDNLDSIFLDYIKLTK